MKIPFLLIVLLGMTAAVRCQTAHDNNPHALRRSESLSDSRMLPVKMDSMHLILGRASSNKERAEICFAISRYYADRLKIDSALYYSNRVKIESEAGKYELGMAKYYISRSHA